MIEGKATIKFGLGSTIITPLIQEDLTVGCLMLQNMEERLVQGASHTYVPTDMDSALIFYNVEAIDALMDMLDDLKDMMLGDLDDFSDFQLHDD